MRPLAEFPPAARRALVGVLTDIDDTLTTGGQLPAVSYAALERLRAAGLLVIPVTGRPAGWCDHIARMWPVDGVVGENGAFWFRHDAKRRRFVKRYVMDASERALRAEKLDGIARRILAAVPGCAIASDQPYREADLAIDFREDVAALPMSAVTEIVGLMEAEGLTAKASSIHVNGWFGDYDKLGMARTLANEVFGIDLEAAKNEFIYAGDSPNDSPMFAFFPRSVGVENVRRFEAVLKPPPAYVTPSAGGAGFAELVFHLLGA